jgi:hypothetical protein
MKKRNANLRESFMDGELLYRKYWEMGDVRSFARLQLSVKESTGILPTQMGVWKCIYRWASMNKNTAYQIYKENDGEFDLDVWVEDMKLKIRRAWQHNTEGKYNRFLKEYGWVE